MFDRSRKELLALADAGEAILREIEAYKAGLPPRDEWDREAHDTDRDERWRHQADCEAWRRKAKSYLSARTEISWSNAFNRTMSQAGDDEAGLREGVRLLRDLAEKVRREYEVWDWPWRNWSTQIRVAVVSGLFVVAAAVAGVVVNHLLVKGSESRGGRFDIGEDATEPGEIDVSR